MKRSYKTVEFGDTGIAMFQPDKVVTIQTHLKDFKTEFGTGHISAISILDLKKKKNMHTFKVLR